MFCAPLYRHNKHNARLWILHYDALYGKTTKCSYTYGLYVVFQCATFLLWTHVRLWISLFPSVVLYFPMCACAHSNRLWLDDFYFDGDFHCFICAFCVCVFVCPSRSAPSPLLHSIQFFLFSFVFCLCLAGQWFSIYHQFTYCPQRFGSVLYLFSQLSKIWFSRSTPRFALRRIQSRLVYYVGYVCKYGRIELIMQLLDFLWTVEV